MSWRSGRTPRSRDDVEVANIVNQIIEYVVTDSAVSEHDVLVQELDVRVLCKSRVHHLAKHGPGVFNLHCCTAHIHREYETPPAAGLPAAVLAPNTHPLQVEATQTQVAEGEEEVASQKVHTRNSSSRRCQ